MLVTLKARRNAVTAVLGLAAAATFAGCAASSSTPAPLFSESAACPKVQSAIKSLPADPSTADINTAKAKVTELRISSTGEITKPLSDLEAALTEYANAVDQPTRSAAQNDFAQATATLSQMCQRYAKPTS